MVWHDTLKKWNKVLNWHNGRGEAGQKPLFLHIISLLPFVLDLLSPFSRPLYVMPKPVGSTCNLACDYCYYLEKRHLYADTPSMLMSDATLETFIRQYIESQTQSEVLFTWHGGEPLLRPLSFYERVLDLQRRYAGDHVIDNCIQTNGTRLTDEWCRFLADNHWLVGISIDGPQHLHDAYRRTRGGGPSFDAVMRGIGLLEKHAVEWNVMGVVNALNADHPLDVYRFYKDIGARYIQFTPIVERQQHHSDGRHLQTPSLGLSPHQLTTPLLPFSVTPTQYAHFLTTVFDEWVRRDVGEVFVQLFDATLACWVGHPPGLCVMAPTCGHALAMEYNGDLYACDHFVFPEYRLGNIHDVPLATLAFSPKQMAFGRAKRDSLPTQCLDCEWLFACNGGCPKDRFVIADTAPSTVEAQRPLNYLCPAYRTFFAHVAPAMDFMANELRHSRPPANIMHML